MKAIWTKIKEVWNKVKTSRLFWEIVVVCIVILIAWMVNNRLRNKNAQLELEKHVITDQMISYKDKDGNNISKIQVLESEKTKNLLKIQSNDSTIKFLQAEVKKYKSQLKEPGSSATVVTSTTDVHGIIPTTVTPNPSNISSPTYFADKSNEWLDLLITARADSTNYKLSVRNKYSVIVGWEKRVPYALVKNFNPYTETTSLRTFQVTVPKQKRIGIGLQGGYGIGSNGLSPYFGVGINYNLFYIK